MARRVCQDLHEATSQQLMMSCITDPVDCGDGPRGGGQLQSTDKDLQAEECKDMSLVDTGATPQDDLADLREQLYVLLRRKDELKSAFAQNQDAIAEKKQRLKQLQGGGTASIT
eukprot:EG_transcript_29777